MKHTSPRYANFQFEFSRVNVILGANGAGKSKFLTELKDSVSALTNGARAVYIEGGRTIKIKDVLQLDHTNVSQFDRMESALAHYSNKRATSLADRVFDALVVLDKRDAQVKSQHSDAVAEWIKGGHVGPCPQRAQPPLDHLFELFNEIFPQITLTYDSNSRRLSAQKAGESYGPSSLSDGEKQVFSILADLIELDETHKLIVADEPELNLHPELAERLWTLIENEFPEKTFIYATHSINFALRQNVQKVYVLSSDSANIAEFTGMDSLPRAEVTAFLGGLPGILSANRVLVTEGHEKSFDAIFYRWLLSDNRIEIYPGGGCADVASIVGKAGLWDKISTRISLHGVIDADFRDDDYLASLASPSVHTLQLHEAESYLCVPEIVCAIASRIGSQEVPLTPDAVKDHILDHLQRDLLIIAAKRLFARSRIALAVSVEKKLLAAAATRDQVVEAIRTSADAELTKAAGTISAPRLEAEFDAEVAKLRAIVDAGDAIAALRYVPSKELLNALAPRAGCKNGADLMRSLRRNFKPTDFSLTSELSRAIEPGAP